VSLIKRNLTKQQKIEVAKGYRLLCKAVIDVALADLQLASVLRDEAAYFFESGFHLYLICQGAGVDPAEVYSAYQAIMESRDNLGITVTKDGAQVGTFDTIAEAASFSGLSYRTVYGMLNNLPRDGWSFVGYPKKGARDIDVLKDGKYICTVPNITSAMGEVNLCYQSVLSMLSTGRKSRAGFQLRYSS
jgi:hypothetical protein